MRGGSSFYTALGLGFLSKGPIVLMLTLAAIVPFLIQGRRLVAGLRRLFDAPGLLLFAAMAASWPLAVAWRDPNAWGVWLTEMSEKTGVLGTLVHRPYALLARHWPGMMFPWSILAMAAVILPFLPSASRPDLDAGRSAEARGPAGPSRRPSPCWFAWWWAVGNMAIFCLWTVAKPNYYVPCMPGMALLAGWAWVRLTRGAQAPPARGGGLAARLVLQAQWVLFFVGGAVAPIVVRPWILRSLWPWTLVLAAVLSVAIVVSVIAWRRGAGAMALAPITAAWALGIVVVYGLLAPADNPLRSHRELARALDRLVPPGVRSIHFFNELDEGLWFYLDGLDLLPVPGTQPQYSTAYDLAEAFHARRDSSDSLDTLDVRREALEKRALLSWLDRRDESSAFLLIRSSLFDRYAARPGRPRDPAPPRDRAEPQGAGPAPRRRPSAPRRVRLARLEMILADLPARVAPRGYSGCCRTWTNVRVGETPPGRVAGLRRSRGHPSLCRSPGLPDRDDRQAFSP